jgi:hypothetical protein
MHMIVQSCLGNGLTDGDGYFFSALPVAAAAVA